MKIAKQAVEYYCTSTGKLWSEFFNRLDEAVETSYDSIGDDYDLWLIKKLVDVISKDISITELKAGKDEIKGIFDEDSRRNAGEFFTPEIWAVEARKYFDKYIPNWHEYNVWDASCYSMDTLIYIRRQSNDTTNGIIDLKVVNAYYQGYVTYDDLLYDDEVLTMNPETLETSWSGFHNGFAKLYSGDYIDFEYDGGVLTVTADHAMWVDTGNKKLTRFTAMELTRYMNLHDDSPINVYDINSCVYSLNNYELRCVKDEIVWDLTTDNDNHVFCVRGIDCRHSVFSGNCGTGNLMRSAGHPVDKMFLSSLQPEDIITVSNTPEYAGATVFQLDFLSELDYDIYNTEFLNKVPPELKDIIVNDKPIIFFMNPPYRIGSAKKTDVGKFMCSPINGDLGQSAYDLFYQFIWRVMHFVEMFNLTNTYYCFFGPLSFFSGRKAQPLYTEFLKCFEFLDGMCIPAQEFSSTSSTIAWGIGCTLWKSRGGYVEDTPMSGVLLEKKVLNPEGEVVCEGKTLYAPPRMRLEDWMQPTDVDFYKQAPLCTSNLTFKGGEIFDKTARKSGTMANNALGIIMYESTLARGNRYSAILSLPCTIQYVNITEENFWRCMASFAFRGCVRSNWVDARRWNSAPDTTVPGYKEWLMNGLVLALCEFKQMATSQRDILWCGDKIDFQNHFFICTEEEVRENCHDEVILKDLETHPPVNQFVLERIEEARPYWTPEATELFEWCKMYILASYDVRKNYGYKGSLNAWDAGLSQLKYVIWSDKAQSTIIRLLNIVREQLAENVSRFGFLSENWDDGVND